ncbi:MAG: DUF1460 domain-containing protein [Deltaproteobacteria bacterium]|nr:DUF1460 domain-containing protein [Deltaproteobacteria bacterium]
MHTLKNENTQILLGKWTVDELDRILQESSKINDAGERIDFLSKMFLGVDYKASTLSSQALSREWVGDANTPEIFVVNLEGMDCMTFIEYIEAMRLSDSFSEFIKNLKIVRYKQGKVTFENRNHFFTDWIDLGFVKDLTGKIGGEKAKVIQKRLNMKGDAGYIIHGVPVKEREIRYIPAEDVDNSIFNKLKTGDYAGMYSQEAWLDVSHVGIVIKTGKQIYLRHASSITGKVVDEDFKEYITKKDGFVLLRHHQ